MSPLWRRQLHNSEPCSLVLSVCVMSRPLIAVAGDAKMRLSDTEKEVDYGIKKTSVKTCWSAEEA
jgi:hypothetical protein